MRVEPCTPEHTETAAKILHDAFFDTHAEAQAWVEEAIETSLICVEGEEVLGCLIYEKDYSHYANYIADIAVAKEHRRKGVALKLIEAFIERSKKEQPKKQPYALSSTDVTNEASIALHKKAGFIELGIVKKLHYGKDEVFFGYKLF
jgi:ribosomal protein S18 acetylase RimI-like enzyme